MPIFLIFHLDSVAEEKSRVMVMNARIQTGQDHLKTILEKEKNATGIWT